MDIFGIVFMNNSLDLSVIMSVYNGQEYLEESIESILGQSYNNFEFIIINDGSTDNTGKIIDKFASKDRRIVSVHHENIGLTKALNRGIKRAKGKYIARQDADDVSMPGRFKSQVEVFKKNSKIVLCGTWFQEINENQGSIIRKYPVEDIILRKNIKYVNYFCHPSVMLVKKAFNKVGGYDESFKIAQDFELWIRLAKTGQIVNLPKVLVKKRIGFSNTISWEKRTEKNRIVKKIILKHFSTWREINIIKFVRYYIPLLVYGFIPAPLLNSIRNIRYRDRNNIESR